MDWQLVTIFDGLDHFVDIGKIETGAQPLGVHIKCDGD